MKAFRIMANKSAEWAAWDDGLLRLELEDLKELNYDLLLTGHELLELDAILKDAAEPEPPSVPESFPKFDEVPGNGLSVVSTFSGGGGSCLGYRMAGYRVLYVSEFIPEAQKTYRLNHPGVYLDTRDIRQVTPEGILEIIGKRPGEIDRLRRFPAVLRVFCLRQARKGDLRLARRLAAVPRLQQKERR